MNVGDLVGWYGSWVVTPPVLAGIVIEVDLGNYMQQMDSVNVLFISTMTTEWCYCCDLVVIT